MVRWGVLILAVAGLCVGAWAVVSGRQRPPEVPLAAEPSLNPYERGIAAAGVVEAATRNIMISAPESGLVVGVAVEVGDRVEAGDVLFELDRRALEAELVRARAELSVAAAQLSLLKRSPRAEEGPPIRAELETARVRLADAEDYLSDVMRAREGQAATQSELSRRRFAAAAAKSEVVRLEGRLALWEAGTWEPEVALGEAGVERAKGNIEAIERLLDRLTVRSPVSGTVLRRNVEPGQYAAPVSAGGSAALTTAAMVVGDLRTLRVRARVDEEDAPRLVPGAEGSARVRGEVATMVPLRMVRIEPLAIPKLDLTGANLERVDTRVVEVVFEVVETPGAGREAGGAGGRALYPGQVVDVFIDSAAPAGGLAGLERTEKPASKDR